LGLEAGFFYQLPLARRPADLPPPNPLLDPPAELQGNLAAGRCVVGFLNPGADLVLDIPREERSAGK
jgi:hypothetical protein